MHAPAYIRAGRVSNPGPICSIAQHSTSWVYQLEPCTYSHLSAPDPEAFLPIFSWS